MKSEKSIFAPGNTPLSLAVLVLPDSNLLSLASVIDPLRAANRLAETELFVWNIYSDRDDSIPLTSGISIPATPLPDNLLADALIIVAGFNLVEHSSPALMRRLRRANTRVQALGGVDGGPWVVASAGLLEGHTATTHWEDLEEMAEVFPNVNVVRDRFTLSGKYFSSGGVSPTIDLVLYLIQSRHGQALSTAVASAYIYDPVHSGSDPQSLISTARLKQRLPKLAQAVDIMLKNMENPPSIAAISHQIGLSSRRLETLFNQEFNQSPGAYFLQLRLQKARRLALDTQRPFSQIALHCGFSSQATFSRAFSRYYHHPPSELRKPHRRMG